MKCSNTDCNRGIGLVAYRRGWFNKRPYCSKYCRDAVASNAQPKDRPVRRLVVASLAFVGLIIPITFTMAVLAAPPPTAPEAQRFSDCDRNLANASAGVAAMQARIKASAGMGTSEVCTATRLYFLEMVKARAVTAVCKSGPDRDRELDRLDADVAHINDAIATGCL